MEAIKNKVIVEKIKEPMHALQVVDAEFEHGKPCRAKVVAIGPDVKTLSVGNEVIVINGIGVNFTKDFKEYFVLLEDEVEALVE